QAGHAAGTAAATNALGALHSTLGAVGRATRYLEHSISIGRSIGSLSLPSALSNVANLYAMGGNLELARARNLMALDLFQASGAIPNAAITLGNLGATCTYLGRFDEADRHLTTALEAAGTVRMANAETIALINLVVLRCHTGRAAEADSYLDRAIELA